MTNSFFVVVVFSSLLVVAMGASPPPGSINIADYGAKGDGSDATSAISKAIIASTTTGQIIWFPSGTYGISSTITLKSNRHYQGDVDALLTMIALGSSGTIFNATDGDADNIVIDSLIFEAAGIYFNTWNKPVNNIQITNCVFQNNSNHCNAGFNNSCPSPYGLFFSGPNGMSNSVISWNTFYNIISWWSEINITADTVVGIGFYAGSNTVFANNRFDLVNEGIKAFEASYACNDLKFIENHFTRIHRIAIEAQCGSGSNWLYSGNYIEQWLQPNWNSYGISARSDASLGVVISNNVILGWEKPDGWYAYAIESNSRELLQVTGNYAYGFFSTAITYCTNASSILNVTGNFVCGSVQWQSGDITPQYGPGCIPPNGAIKPNTDLQYCTNAPPLPPVPSSGAGNSPSSSPSRFFSKPPSSIPSSLFSLSPHLQ